MPCHRFRDARDDDRSMEVGWRQITAEEKRSERLGASPHRYCRRYCRAPAFLVCGGAQQRIMLCCLSWAVWLRHQPHDMWQHVTVHLAAGCDAWV